MGRPLSITDANGVVTDLEYNARGWLTKSTVRHGTGDAVTLIEYSPAGDVTKVTLPDSSYLTYIYDDARRLTAITNQLGEKIEFTYDLASNVTQQVTKDAGGTIKRTQTRAMTSSRGCCASSAPPRRRRPSATTTTAISSRSPTRSTRRRASASTRSTGSSPPPTR